MRSFCNAKLQKLLTFFSKKSEGVLQILTFEILTKRSLTTSLVLNNRALVFKNVLFIFFSTKLSIVINDYDTVTVTTETQTSHAKEIRPTLYLPYVKSVY